MESQKTMDKKFETQDYNLFQIWDEIQCVQANVCFSQEVSAYYMSENWIHKAKNILDVGTGNGFFLSKISERFPEKFYTGIDISKELIEKAKQDRASSNITYKINDYFDVEGQFDFVIMRLFWQHLSLKQITDALIKLEKLTKPGAGVIISDSWDRARVFVPDLPEFRRVVSAYTEQQIENSRDRNIIDRLLKEISHRSEWEVERDLKIILPSTVNNNLKLFQRTYELWIKLFECLGDLTIDFTAAKEELNQWQKDTSAYTQVGLRILLLTRSA